MLEVIAILGQLRAQGWRPLRSIVFASWDAKEYNMIGSTEYVEDHIDELRTVGVAYLNVDAGVVGPNFRAAASPILQRAIFRILDRVVDPVENRTLRALWQEKGNHLEGLGSGSDYVAFQDLAGISSIDFGFSGEGYPYHSCYETYEWMEKFGDPGLIYHKTLAQVWVLLILELSAEGILPFGLTDYAKSIEDYITNLQSYAERKGAPWGDENGEGGFDLKPLYDASHAFRKAAKHMNEWEDWWFGEVYARGGIETNALASERIAHNDKASDFETDLLDIPRQGDKKGPFGIPGREQFKHIVFGPQLWSGYDEAYFPFIRDAIDAGNWTAAQLQVHKTARILAAACEKLVKT
jgi:N-acetylated-alpha-linked acidic dipeptidase